MGKSTISMAIFNCYVSSPEGTKISAVFFGSAKAVDIHLADAVLVASEGSKVPGPLGPWRGGFMTLEICL